MALCSTLTVVSGVQPRQAQGAAHADSGGALAGAVVEAFVAIHRDVRHRRLRATVAEMRERATRELEVIERLTVRIRGERGPGRRRLVARRAAAVDRYRLAHFRVGNLLAAAEVEHAVPPAPAGCADPAPFPQAVHTVAPSSSGGDVTGAFVDQRGCKLAWRGINAFAIWNDPPRVALDGDDYEEMRRHGFTGVRLVAPWRWFEPERGRFVNLEMLDTAIARAKAAGLYVVLDPLHDTPPDWTAGSDHVSRVLDGSQAWLKLLAQRYRDEPAVVAYDLVNEPDTRDRNRMLDMYSTIIGWLREVDPDRIAVVENPWGSMSMAPGFADERHLTHRRNVVYSYHDYYAGDRDRATISAGFDAHGLPLPGATVDGSTGYPELGDAADHAAQLGAHMEFARRADVPLWIGEFGISFEATNAREWIADKLALFRRTGVGYTWWYYSCGEKFAVRDAACAWKPAAADLGRP